MPLASSSARPARAGAPGTVATTRPPAARETDKAKGIREDLDALNAEYFGVPQHTPNVASAAGAQQATTAANGDPRLSRPARQVRMPLSASWAAGPVDPAGRLMDASDANLLCMDVAGDQVVAGGADHGLSVWDLRTAKKSRTLFSKRCGHTEWVTACAFTPGGQILSGGMDSALWLWGRAGVNGDCLSHPTETHRGGISNVLINPAGLALSSSYDRTVKLWNTNQRANCAFVGTLSGHKQPVMHLLWHDTTVLSGDRGGLCILWDLERMASVAVLPTAGGQVGSVGSLIDSDFHLLFAGDQAGNVTGWDVRTDPTKPATRSTLHPGGAVTAVHGTSMGSDNFLITAGADKVMHCIDPRGGFDRPLFTWKDHKDFIYAVTSHANMIFSSGGNGWLLAHDVDAGKCAYGIGAGKNAMRCIATTDARLVCAGDDGKIMAYDFP